MGRKIVNSRQEEIVARTRVEKRLLRDFCETFENIISQFEAGVLEDLFKSLSNQLYL